MRGAFDRTQRKGVIMSRLSKSHIAVLLAIGAIIPMQLLDSRPGRAETLGTALPPLPARLPLVMARAPLQPHSLYFRLQ